MQNLTNPWTVFHPTANIFTRKIALPNPGNFDLSRPHNIQAELDDDENISSIPLAEINNGFPDGMTVDVHGNLFVCDPNGKKIHIFESSSNYIGNINIPERVANCILRKQSDLYITASTSLYRKKFNTGL